MIFVQFTEYIQISDTPKFFMDKGQGKVVCVSDYSDIRCNRYMKKSRY